MPHEMLPSVLYHMTCAPENFEVAVSNGLEEDPIHHVTYTAAKVEVATANGLGWDAFTWKLFIWPFP